MAILIRIFKIVTVACFSLLSACGTYIPSTRTWPNDNSTGEDDMAAMITRTISCELSFAVTEIISIDQDDVPYRLDKASYTNFLKDWGVQVAVNLTIAERSSVNPTAILTPLALPTYAFTAAGGLSASTEAQRIQKTNMFYTVAELYRPDIFNAKKGGREKCATRTGNRHGSPLVNSDLKLDGLLSGRLSSARLGFAPSPGDKPLLVGEKNVLSQSVLFKIQSSGSVTPKWTLVRAQVNPSGTFFSAGRDDTQELVFTFGPLDQSVKGQRSLNRLAEAVHINTQLQTGIQSSFIPFR